MSDPCAAVDALDALIREGAFEQAAELALSRGEREVAVELFGRAWNERRAAEVALEAGLVERAYKHALASRDAALLHAARARVAEDAVLAQRLAHWADERGHALEAGHLLLASGSPEEAARALSRGGDELAAAEAWARASRWVEAGRAYESRVREAPHDERARLALVAILVRLQRFEAAAATLQQGLALREDAELLRWLVGTLAALGYDGAAQDRLALLRALEPRTPSALDAFLVEQFGSAQGLRRAGPDHEALVAGRYRIVRTLGAGGSGRVMLARDVLTERDVALKLLHASGTERGRDALARFCREARLAMAIEHPSLVRVYELDASVPYLTMELMQGGSLAERLEARGALGVGESLAVTRSLLSALDALHRRGVVHRDLKPANVFFDAAGHAKLGDLGAAHLIERGATLTGSMVGTLATMAPEQLRGDVAPDARTDFYALGVVLTQMLTGGLPHPGPDFAMQHLHAEPALPSVLRPALGERFDEIVERLLRKAMDERPGSIDEIERMLSAIDASELSEAPIAPPRPSPSPSPAVHDEHDERYEDRGALDATARRLFDRWLEREVRCVRCADRESFDVYVTQARVIDASRPNVLDVDVGTMSVWLEMPRAVL